MAGLKGVDLTAMVDQMTTSMLGEGVDETDDALDTEARQVVGCVHLTGEGWLGSILVAMPEDAARAATSTMFMLGDEDADDELVADAMGEFANVLAGMAKGAIGGGCQLSLPSVTSGGGLRVAVPGATLVDRRSYSLGAGSMTVTTLESTGRSST